LSYVSAFYDKYAGKILVWEKKEQGSRVRRELVPNWYFYTADRLGDYESITGVRLKKITCLDSNDFDQAVMSHPSRFESDFSPLDRALMDNYSKIPAPHLAVGFIDIEVDYKEDSFQSSKVLRIRPKNDESPWPAETEMTLGPLRKLSSVEQRELEVFDPELNKWLSFEFSKYKYEGESGFAGPANPYAPINALTLYNVDEKKYYTWVLAPRSWAGELPVHLDYVKICKDEKELLTLFLEELHKLDLISGWNSEFYDLPYIGKRIELIFGEHALSMLAFEGGPKPRWSEKARFKHSKNMDLILELNSRVHLDYMLLVKKFNLTTRPSFALNSVAMDELDEQKLHYDGTLAELYNNDFIKFIEYNKHDVTLLIRLDQKFKYIELANRMVHEATVNFKSIYGAVALIETAVANFAHNVLNKIVCDKQIRPEGDPVEGALVMTPEPGFYEWIGACDINSLYPSTIRSLNLSPEKIVGQIQQHEAGWRTFYDARLHPSDKAKQQVELLVMLDGTDEEMAIEVGELITICNEKKWVVSGFGTILDQNEEGLLAAVLTFWFNGRKEMQAEKKKWTKEANKILNEGIKLNPEELSELL
jgi:DNA polymerase elongation subunit (family B)